MPSANSILRLLHTTRHLRPRQMVAQVPHRLRRLVEDPQQWQSRWSPEFPGCRWQPRSDFLPPGIQQNSAQDILRGRLTFLNDTRNVGWPPKWSRNHLPKLWQYNLHYFEYLWPLDYPQAKTLVLDWIEKHPIHGEHVGWEAYPTSLRLVNWCCVFFGRFRRQTEADKRFGKLLWKSIFLQAEWLRSHVETHLLGNHLFENGAALAALGHCFHGSSAERWYRQGINILAKQIPEQILSDGGHFERSPMYHTRILFVLLLLANVGDEETGRLVRPAVGRMREALSRMCHPDGQIALLNDSALGIYNKPKQLIRYADRLPGEPDREHLPPVGPFALPETGYYGARSDSGDYVICDAGPVGPDYIPGHAHGDIFSFELSLGPQRVIVDSGVYDYLPGEMRSYCRSTRAHNTVEIEGQDQCEFWGAFRVARRGRARDVLWHPSGEGFRLAAWHDGYRRLPGSPRHRREFVWHNSQGLNVNDLVTASRPLSAVARLHLHPCCRITRISAPAVEVSYPAGTFTVKFSGNGALSVAQSFCCPEFGKRIARTALAFSFRGSNIKTGFQIQWQ